MRYTQKRPKKKLRIDKVTGVMMYSTAGFFYALTYVPKIFYLIASGTTAIALFVPVFGELYGVAAEGLAIVLDEAFTTVFVICGYLTLWVWFQMRSVPIYGGKSIGRKAALLPATLLIGILPVFNIIPGIIIWTYFTIQLSRKEDEEAHAKLIRKFEAEQAHMTRMQQQALRTHAANDNLPLPERTTNDNTPQKTARSLPRAI